MEYGRHVQAGWRESVAERQSDSSPPRGYVRTTRRGRPPKAKELPEWKVSDVFWKLVEPLIPRPKKEKRKLYKRKHGGGRKPLPYRRVFEGILYVLRMGCQWNAIPKERFGAPSTIHRYFTQWLRLGFFLALWNAGLAEYDEMKGIAWHWHTVDGATIEALPETDATGRDPTEPGGKGKRTQSPGGRVWHPAVVTRQRGQSA